MRTQPWIRYGLLGLCVLPGLLVFPLFRERPWELGEGFYYLRFGLALASFMIYMAGKYTVGFVRMARVPWFFPAALKIACVMVIMVLGLVAVLYGKWWVEYLPHGLVGAYAAWRIKA